MYVYQLSFEHLEVLATLTSASVITFHVSHNIRLAALTLAKGVLCPVPLAPRPVGGVSRYNSFSRVVIPHVNLQLFRNHRLYLAVTLTETRSALPLMLKQL